MKITEEYFNKLTATFNRFAGQEISFTEQKKTFEGREYTELVPVDKRDPVVTELRQELGQPNLRFILQDKNWKTGARATYPAVQAFVKKGKDNKYHLSPKWNLGII